MKILVYEHMTARGHAAGPAALLEEGGAMIRALLADLARVQGIDVLSLRSPDVHIQLPGEVRLRCSDQDFHRAVHDCDAVWLIAPETGGCLEKLARTVAAGHRQLINCAPEAIALCASKLATARCLTRAGVPVIPCFSSADEVPSSSEWIVVKPDDGAGCVDTYVIRRGDAPSDAHAVFQPFVEGEARSFAMLCDESSARLLCVNKQHVHLRGDRLVFEGVTTAAVAHGHAVIADLAARIHSAISGLRGLVGVDYVETARGPVVIEVNPRLISAYRGMSRRLGVNVAELVLQAFAQLVR